ncbi:MAG: 3-hydroxyacyl-CoA dehydrogenase family protein, partial [Bacteroidales bacterium]|nr:3-hydroxyacyl-CoA dehydrogenase family protein [Bacteroidales bacterium]
MQQPKYTIGIVGCGKMGTNLFHFLAGFPFRLILICKSTGAAEKIKQTFKRKLERSLKHGLTDRTTYDFRLSNTIISYSLRDLKDCDLVIESISENLEFKKDLFQNLDQIISKTCILASNSSSISPEYLIPHKKRKHNTIGLHFFYPVALTDLAEVNTLNTTSPETIGFIKSFLNQINKFQLVFSETSNFTINKMFLKLQAGCCELHRQYGLSYASIDAIIKEALFPVGVFEFFDHVGIDTMLAAV